MLNILYQDSGYHKQHKVLLAKALKWERQNKNPSILLRGYNLLQAEAWLKVAQQRTLHLPTALHETFIYESAQQPESATAEVFISYSRADADFARKLNEALQNQGKITWFDQESIDLGSDFQKEIYQGIENSANFVFVISPDSVNSPYCTDEVDYAQSLNKRIVTVLHRSVDAAQLPATLRDLQWVDFNQHHGDFYANFSELIRTLDTDRAHVRSHTKWLQRATEWEKEGKSDDLLLRGSEFAVAEYWLQKAESEEKYPPATELQKTFLQVSKDAIATAEKREKRQAWMLRSLLGVASTVAVVAIVTSIFAVHNQRKAVKGEVDSLVATAEARYSAGQELESLLIGLEAAQKLKESRKNPVLEGKVMNVLNQAMDSVQEYNTLDEHKSSLHNLHIQPNGRVITASEDGTARVWDQKGAHLVTLSENQQIVWLTETSNNGQNIVTLSDNYEDGISFVNLWDSDGTLEQVLDKQENDHFFTDLTVSPDSQIIAAANSKGEIKLWNSDGRPTGQLNHEYHIEALTYSPDGQTLASAGGDQTVKLWKKGELSATLEGHDRWLADITYSPDGTLIASADFGGTVKLWTEKGEKIVDLTHGESGYTTVLFSKDSQTIATAGGDQVKIWNRKGQQKAILTGNSSATLPVAFGQDQTTNTTIVATVNDDNTLKLWDADGNLLKTLKGHKDDVIGVKFSPDNKSLVSISADRTAKLWQLNRSSALKTLTPDFGDMQPWQQASDFINFSPEGKVFTTLKAASNSEEDSSIQLWSMDGRPAKQLTTIDNIYSSQRSFFSEDGKRLVVLGDNVTTLFQGNGTPIKHLLETDQVKVTFSPDNQWIVTAERDGPVRLWQAETGIRAITLEKSSKGDVDVRFSPDSSLITASDEEGTVKLWNIDGDLVARLPNNNGDTPTEVFFSSDSQLFATAVNPSGYGSDSYGPVILWQRDGTLISDALVKKTDHTALRQESHRLIAKFSANSQTLVTGLRKGDMGGPIQLWGIDGTLIKTLVAETEAFVDFQVSPEGSTILTYQDEGPVILWETDGTKIKELTDEGQNYQLVEFSPDGQVLALLSQDALQIWHGVTGKLIEKFEHPAAFNTLAFSTNSQLLAVNTTDNLVHIWKHTKPQVLTTVAGHTDQVDFLDFSADNDQLITVSRNETVIRDLNELKDLEILTERACQRAQAYLATHPEKLEELEICQTNAIKTAAAPAWERLGKTLMAEGNKEEALKAFHKANQWQKFGLTPEEKAEKAGLIGQWKELAAKGQFEEARSKFNQALDLDPMDPSLNSESESRVDELAAKALVQEGEDLIAANDMSAAIQKFEQALELSPDSLETAADLHANQVMASLLLDKFNNLIWNGEEKEEFLEAIKLQAKVIGLAPDLITYRHYLNFCLQSSLHGHTEKLLEFCERAVKLTPAFEKHMARAYRGIARAQTGDMEGALADWEFFLKVYNENGPDVYIDSFNRAVKNASDWVELLKKGENPFVSDVLAELREHF